MVGFLNSNDYPKSSASGGFLFSVFYKKFEFQTGFLIEQKAFQSYIRFDSIHNINYRLVFNTRIHFTSIFFEIINDDNENILIVIVLFQKNGSEMNSVLNTNPIIILCIESNLI